MQLNKKTGLGLAAVALMSAGLVACGGGDGGSANAPAQNDPAGLGTTTDQSVTRTLLVSNPTATLPNAVFFRSDFFDGGGSLAFGTTASAQQGNTPVAVPLSTTSEGSVVARSRSVDTTRGVTTQPQSAEMTRGLFFLLSVGNSLTTKPVSVQTEFSSPKVLKLTDATVPTGPISFTDNRMVSNQFAPTGSSFIFSSNKLDGGSYQVGADFNSEGRVTFAGFEYTGDGVTEVCRFVPTEGQGPVPQQVGNNMFAFDFTPTCTSAGGMSSPSDKSFRAIGVRTVAGTGGANRFALFVAENVLTADTAPRLLISISNIGTNTNTPNAAAMAITAPTQAIGQAMPVGAPSAPVGPKAN